MSKLPSTTLEFREGSSDKVYKAAVEEAPGGYAVNFAFGRRGSTLQTGTKTQAPVSLAEATGIYDKLVLSKTAKGYKPTGESDGIGASVAAAVTDRDQRDTGLRPQLLNPISEDQAQTYLHDASYAAQEKFDGKRMMIRKDKDGIVAANRKGLSIGFPDAIAKALSAIKDAFVVDGEAVGDTFHAFDLLEANGSDLRGEPYFTRLDMLKAILGGCPKAVVVARTALVEDKFALMKDLMEANKEGIVFKELNAQWHAGRPASGGPALKCKFWSSCSAVVSKINAKRSIEVSLSGQPVGNITIPPNHDLPAVGQVVEVRYLYVAGKGGSLYQPVYLGVRDDVDPEDCTFDKQRLKYKPENED